MHTLYAFIKSTISHKPDSVTAIFLIAAVIIYLAASLLMQSCCLPFNVAVTGIGRAALNVDIRGITAHKVYP